MQPTLALVKDNSLFGYTSRFYGERYRFEVSPSFGGWRFTQLLADYRRYKMLIFPASLSFRAMALGRLGRDGGNFPVFLGYPDMVRGYTFALVRRGRLQRAHARRRPATAPGARSSTS